MNIRLVHAAASLSERTLLDQLVSLVRRDRNTTTELLACMGEIDSRKIWAKHLTQDNHHDVLRRAMHKSMREIEELVTEIAPQPDVASKIRMLPRRSSTTTTVPQGFAREAVGESPGQRLGEGSNQGPVAKEVTVPKRHSATRAVTPLSPRRYKVQVTVGHKTHDKLVELQALLSHQVRDGDLAVIFDRAFDALLDKARKQKASLTHKPRNGAKRVPQKKTRAVPAAVRRTVFERDQGRCAFVSADGKRCGGTTMVEFHHCRPFGLGGGHEAQNVALRCRAHNQYEADLDYGRALMDNKRRSVTVRAECD